VARKKRSLKKKTAYKSPTPIQKKQKPLVIDASKKADASVLPVRVNGKAMHTTEGALLTLDRLADEVGGRSEFVNMCRLSDDPEVMEFVRKCEVEGDSVTIGGILEHMNLRAGKILASVVPALYEYGGQVAKLINAIHSPKVMQDSIKSSTLMGMDGFSDRKMQLEIAGIIQRQGGININLPGAGMGGMERPEATLRGTARRVDEEEVEEGEIVQPDVQ
jgi:hypothetical protein